MTWPTTPISTTNLDSNSDSPLSARSDLKAAADALNALMAHVSAFVATLLDDATAADFRTTLDVPSLASLALNSAKAVTTGGTSTAFTATPTPALAANTARAQFDVIFNAAAGASPTLAVSGLSALPLKYRDTAGSLQTLTANQAPANWCSPVMCDGTNWVVLVPAVIDPFANQTYTNYTASRSVGSTYTNSTSRTIEVSVILSIFSGSNTKLTIGGVDICQFSNNGSGGNTVTVQGSVPPGATYVVTGGTLSLWLEKR